MFFSISKSNTDNRFSNNYTVDSFVVSVDNGWSSVTIDGGIVLFKGYVDTRFSLQDMVNEFVADPTPRYSGNFCFLIIKNNSITITHDTNRSFPVVVYKNGLVTNLYQDTLEVDDNIWSDCYIKITNTDIKKKYFDCFLHTNQSLTEQEGIRYIIDLLNSKAEQLSKNVTEKVKVFLSGGVDTTLVYSLLKANLSSEQYSIVPGEVFEFTEFTLKNYDVLTKNPNCWGYTQMHHWKVPTVYATGAMGDEIFLRGPTTAGLWAAWHNINLIDKFESLDYSYHKKYFLRDKNKKTILNDWNNRHKIQQQIKTKEDLVQQIKNNIANDHQHWHLENTITWTPLKDIRILDTILSLPDDVVLDQILYGSLDKKIINGIYNGMDKIVCTHKNYNQFHNLFNLKEYVEALNA